jgi:hypothetical protein
VLDGTVFPRRVHGLEHDQHRIAILGVEPVLQLGEDLDAGAQRFDGARLVPGGELAGIGGVDVAQAEFSAVGDAVRAREPARFLERACVFHAGKVTKKTASTEAVFLATKTTELVTSSGPCS